MKRIIILICCLSVLITFFIIPVAATENDGSAFQPNFQDLLSLDYEYVIKGFDGTTLKTNQTVRDPGFYASTDGRKFVITWGSFEDKFTADYVYIMIQSTQVPKSVTFGVSDKACTLVGASGGYYTYKLTLGGSFSASFQLSIIMQNGYRGSVNLSGVYGVFNNTYLINEVNYQFYGELLEKEGSYLQSFYEGSSIVPFVYEKTFSSDSPFVCPSPAYIEFDFPVPTPYADSVTVTFASANEWPNDYTDDKLHEGGGVVLIKDGSTQEALSFTVSDCVATSAVYGQVHYITTMNVDLSGVDLSNSFLKFRIYLGLKYQYSESESHATFFHFKLLNVALKNVAYSKPWYVRFYYWIRDEFTDLKETINSAFGSGQAAPDISDQQQQIDDSVTDMDDIGNEIDSSRQEMDELMPSMPSWKDTGLEGFDNIVGAFIQEIRIFFLAIYSNHIINQILTYTFLFALGGFILFGERM